MKQYLRKIKSIIETVIGTATVVTPELVINKKWNANVDKANDIMKVPSKNFYDYLGLYMCPDAALKDENTYGEGNYGLGLGPYNNDLGLAVDKKVYSSPAPVPMELVYSSEGVSESFYDANDSTQPWELRLKSESAVIINSKGGYVDNDDNEIDDYDDRVGFTGIYEWQGEWGDIENGFETGVDVQINTNINCEKVPGGLAGDLIPTGGTCTIWLGDNGDIKTDTEYRKIVSTKHFYNQHFSTGFLEDGNGAKSPKVFNVKINRKPYETKLRINGVAEARGGKYVGLPNPFIGLESSIKGLDIPNPAGGVLIPLGSLLWNIVAGFFQFLNDILELITGNKRNYAATVTASAEIVSKRIAVLDKSEIIKHPAYKYFQTPGTFAPISYHAYLYTQFYYPFFNQNPLYPYTTTFNYKKPFLENAVIPSRFFNNLTKSDSHLSKKYTHFVPSLFCLLYETKIGVFYEQLAKQLKNDSDTNNEKNLNIKLKDHLTSIDPKDKKEKQETNLHDLMFPTNETNWNNYLENTGWPDDATTGNLNFLGNFIEGATVADVPNVGTATFSHYENVFTEYPTLPQDTVSNINEVIGDFVTIQNILKQDDGYKLNTWNFLCDENNGYFKTLSSGEPKNLSYKIIQFILWYLEPNGIVEQTRLSVNSLLEYEKLLEDDIDDFKNTPSTKNFRDYHIVGTEIYERECKN